MSSSHTEGSRPPADAFVDDEVEAAESQRRSQRENVSEAMLSISHQYTIDRLVKVEELLSTNRATVHQLSRADIKLLEAMDPDSMPASIKEKIKDVNQTVMMRIAAAEQGPQRVKEVRGDLFKAPENAVLIRRCTSPSKTGKANRSDACNTKGLWGMGIAAEFRDRVCIHPNQKAPTNHQLDSIPLPTNFTSNSARSRSKIPPTLWRPWQRSRGTRAAEVASSRASS